jgi:hypothetical protein
MSSKKQHARLVITWCDGSTLVENNGHKIPVKKVIKTMEVMIGMMTEIVDMPTAGDLYKAKQLGKTPHWVHPVVWAVQSKTSKKGDWTEAWSSEELVCEHQKESA